VELAASDHVFGETVMMEAHVLDRLGEVADHDWVDAGSNDGRLSNSNKHRRLHEASKPSKIIAGSMHAAKDFAYRVDI
jgi:hypothetical protein